MTKEGNRRGSEEGRKEGDRRGREGEGVGRRDG